MIKRFSLSLLAATAIGVVATQGASAADMAVKAPPVVAPPPPLWNWTGLYAGGVFGLGVSRNKLTDTNNGQTNFVFEGLCGDCADTGAFGQGGINLGTQIGVGPQGGFVLGYKWQGPNSPFVWGIDGQFSFADIQGSTTTSDSLSVFFPKNPSPCFKSFRSCQINSNHSLNLSSKVKDIATIAGVFGITSGPQDRTLWYVKGGAAWAKTNWNANDSFNGTIQTFGATGRLHPEESFTAVGGSSFSGDKNRWGWMVGTGVEFGLWGNWSAKIEYDFLDFGSYDLTQNSAISISDPVCGCAIGTTSLNRTLHVDQQIHLVQVGLNYKFDWGGGKGVWH